MICARVLDVVQRDRQEQRRDHVADGFGAWDVINIKIRDLDWREPSCDLALSIMRLNPANRRPARDG